MVVAAAAGAAGFELGEVLLHAAAPLAAAVNGLLRFPDMWHRQKRQGNFVSPGDLFCLMIPLLSLLCILLRQQIFECQKMVELRLLCLLCCSLTQPLI